MKCHKPGTDQHATLTVSANGMALPEYVLKTRRQHDPNTVECFIPVSNGEQLTINGSFSGTGLHGAFDLLVDGSFLAEKRHEGKGASKEGEKTNFTRRLSFEKVLDTPVPEGYTSLYLPKDVTEGNLHVKQLDQAPSGPAHGDELGVGSLAVIIWINQKSDEQCAPAYASATCGSWRERDHRDTCDGGIPPTHELEVKVLDDKINSNRRTKHRRHFTQQRFGKKAWARMIFYYRSRMAINETDCRKLEDSDDFSLEAWDPKEPFEGKEPKAKQTKSKQKTEPNANATNHHDAEDDMSDEIVVGGQREYTPDPRNTPLPYRLTNETPIDSIETDNERHDSGGLFVSPSPSGENGYSSEESHSKKNGGDGSGLPGVSSFKTEPRTGAENHQQEENSEPEVKASLEHYNRASLDANVTPRDQPFDPLVRPKILNAQNTAVTWEEVAELRQAHGIITKERLQKFLADSNLDFRQVQSFVQPVGSNFTMKDKDTLSNFQGSRNQTPKMKGPGGDFTRPRQQSQAASHIKVETAVQLPSQPPTQPSMANRPNQSRSTNPANTNTTPTSHTAGAPTPPSLQRQISHETTSRESTPSRKASKLADLQARKAEILKKNLEKQKQNQKFKNDLDAERKRLAEEEAEYEKVMKELEAAEQAGKDLDAEAAELDRMRAELYQDDE